MSTTVTRKLALELFPDASVAVQLTIVVPIANTLPDGGVHVRVGVRPLSSVAVTT